ncbi:MAG: hypothetical protein VB934_00020, partial [Polyangiaceae bacterium]
MRTGVVVAGRGDGGEKRLVHDLSEGGRGTLRTAQIDMGVAQGARLVHWVIVVQTIRSIRPRP